MIKNKKVFAISAITVFVCIGVLCYALMVYDSNDYKQYTDKLGGVRFLKTDWGMTVSETMYALKKDKIDVKLIQSNSSMKPSYITKKEIDVNGLKAKVQFDFSSQGNLILPYLGGKDNIAGGLYSVKIYINSDDETIFKAFEKELSEDAQILEEKGKNVGYVSNKVKFTDIKDKKIYNKMDKIIKGTSMENMSDELYLNKVIVKQITDEKIEGGYTHIVEFDGRGLAVLNNADRKMLGLKNNKTLL